MPYEFYTAINITVYEIAKTKKTEKVGNLLETVHNWLIVFENGQLFNYYNSMYRF